MISNRHKFSKEYDVIIIGSGPVGLIAAYEVQKSGKKCLLISNDLNLNYQQSSSNKNTSFTKTFSLGGLAKRWHNQNAVLDQTEFGELEKDNKWPLTYTEYMDAVNQVQKKLGIKLKKNNIYKRCKKDFKVSNQIEVNQIFTTISRKKTWDFIFEELVDAPLIQLIDLEVVDFDIIDNRVSEIVFNNGLYLELRQSTQVFLAAGCLYNTILSGKILDKLQITNQSIGKYLTDHPMYVSFEIESGPTKGGYESLFIRPKFSRNQLLKRKFKVSEGNNILGVFEIRHFYTARSLNEDVNKLSYREMITIILNRISKILINRIFFKPLKSEIWIQLSQTNNIDSKINFVEYSYELLLNEEDLINYKKIVNSAMEFVRNLGFSIKSNSELSINLEELKRKSQDAYHYSGTTRFANTSKDGVVDKNGQLYGTNNVYVYGASIFPVSSWINPTLTAMSITLHQVQLAISKLK